MLVVRTAGLLIAISACGDPTNVDPKDLKTEDLHGRWVQEVVDHRHVFTFQERAPLHPALADQTNVFAIYDVQDNRQSPLIFGTYRVEAGVIVQQPVWAKDTGTVMNQPEYRNDVITFIRGAQLTIEGADGLPSNYEPIEECIVGTSVDGWRHYATSVALWNMVDRSGLGGSSPLTTTVALDTTGALIATTGNSVVRYGGECIPEATNEDPRGASLVTPAPDGVHVLTGTGPHNAATAFPVGYSKHTNGPLRLAPRPVPIDGRQLIDVADLGGKLGMLLGDETNALLLVRDDGASFTTTPVVSVPPQFSPTELLDAVNGRALIVGSGYPSGSLRLMMVEETASGFVSTQIPVDTLATYVAAAADNGDLWIVYAASLDPGAARPRLLHLVTRRSGTWSPPIELLQGALPQLVVRDGVAHVVSLAARSQEATAYYTRIDAGGVTQWRALFAPTGLSVPAKPTIAVADDGTVTIGSQGHIRIRGPNDRDQRRAPVTVTIAGTGRVSSSDGVINCTQSCTVMVDVGRRLHVTATPAGAGVPVVNCTATLANIDVDRSDICDVDVTPPSPETGIQPEIMISATFP